MKHYLKQIDSLISRIGALTLDYPKTTLITSTCILAFLIVINVIHHMPHTAVRETQSLAIAIDNELSQHTEAHSTWHTVVVKPGDSLAAIFSRVGISAAELQRLIHNKKAKKVFLNLQPGHKVLLQLNSKQEFLAVNYRLNRTDTLIAKRNDKHFDVVLKHRPLEERLAYSSSTIRHTHSQAAEKAHLPMNVTMQLIKIFGWDIDFAKEIRVGDSFRVLFKEYYANGERIKTGEILAAEFTHSGHTYQAVGFEDKKHHLNYYTPSGRSLQKRFLRIPVKYTRISSFFSRGRYHPILHRSRAHHGIDYAAPRGTPIHSTGNGKIIFRGRKGGYGNVIIIKHGSIYSTLYAHMKKFARGLHIGSHVKQGQVIGYVGSTGLSTGPHLHYEFRVRGAHKDPLHVKLPKGSPIPKAQRKQFLAESKRLLNEIDTHNRTRLATNGTADSA